jgi:hypothetical protein
MRQLDLDRSKAADELRGQLPSVLHGAGVYGGRQDG